MESVRARLAQPRFVPDPGGRGRGDAFGGGPTPAPGIGADLSGGSASATLALLAAGLPGMPGTLPGAPGSLAGERLLAVTFNDLAAGGLPGCATAELDRARADRRRPAAAARRRPWR